MWMAKLISLVVSLAATSVAPISGQEQSTRPARPQQSGPSQPSGSVELPPEYVIGPEDVLSIHFWRDTDMTRDEVTVRPDGRITLPLIGDVVASGLTPEELKTAIEQAVTKYQKSPPNVTVLVRQINSRKVFITGSVANPGAHPLSGPRTVMQLIALAGGLTEFADKKNLQVMRTEPNGQTRAFKFNYDEVSKGKNLQQNILLKPGDTVVVP